MLKPKYVVNINARNEDGCNAMHFLMTHFGIDVPMTAKITQTLLKKGIEVNLLNKAELSPLHVAIKNFQNKALKFAFDYNNAQRQALNVATSNPFLPGASRLFNFNIQGKLQWAPMHYAVFSNNLLSVILFLESAEKEDLDLFSRDEDWRMPRELCPYNSPIFKMILGK